MSQPEYRTPTPLISPNTTASVVMVDADTATKWLTCNISNRKVRNQRVTQFARDMTQGEWHMTGEPVKFAVDGTLLDGQHRLMAVRRARVVVPMLVVSGLAPETQSYMDTGASRTAGDALSLAGERHARELAAVTKFALGVQRGHKTGTTCPQCSHADVFEWISAHPEVRDAVDYGNSRHKRDGPLTVSTLAYCYFRLAAVDPDAAMSFLDSVASGANIALDSPQLALRDRVFKIRSDQHSVLRMIDIVYMVFTAWNRWRRSQPTKTVQVPEPGRELPRIR